MTTNGNGWKTAALSALGALLLLLLSLALAERRHDHRQLEDHETRIKLLEAKR